MAWISLTIDSLKSALTQTELDKLPVVARNLDYEPEDLLEAAISEVLREIRGHVGAKFSLGTAGTIPDELEGAALALIRRRIFGRVPGTESLFGEIRKKEAEDAQTLLRRIAKGEFAIVPPQEQAAEQPGNFASQVVQSRPPLGGLGGL